MTKELKDLLARHKQYIAAWGAAGGRVRRLELPCCKGELDIPAPHKGERQWDSLMACPHCGATVMKVVTYERPRPRFLETARTGHQARAFGELLAHP